MQKLGLAVKLWDDWLGSGVGSQHNDQKIGNAKKSIILSDFS